MSRKIKSAEELLREETGEIRHLRKFERILIGVIAVAWALFQLSLASWLILDSTKTRAIHLAFAVVLLFLNIPIIKKPKGWLKKIVALNKISIVDYLLAIAGAVSALYIMLAWEGLATRQGAPITIDIIAGLAILVLLLEATRRSIGPALSIIALVFTAYAFFGPYMPDVLAFKGVSLNKYLNQISLSTEGIYGIPLGVSASIVYLFVLLGAMLDKAGAGRFFIDLALSLLGRFKGGPAKAAIVASGLTGLVSGSSIANVVTTGTFTIPLMKKVGYPAKKAAAVEVAASTDGQIMPPIMGAAAFIIAEYVNVPYLEVVKAAAIPAFVSYTALFYVVHIEASKLGMKGLPKEETPRFFATLKGGIHYLLPIAMLVYELVVLRHSPEKAAFNAILVLIAIILISGVRKGLIDKSIGFGKGLFEGLFVMCQGFIAGSRNMVAVALATASAGIIVGVVNMGIGGMITMIVEQLSGGSIFLLLFITAVASLLLGMGLPTTATYIVMASLTAPIIVEVGGLYGFIVPLMAAHLFCFYFGILADDTPPVGLAAYAASAIADSDPIPTGLQSFSYDMRTAIIPFFFIFNTDLILHNIFSWTQGLLVFVMACLGAFSFASAVQGWYITKNKWYEIPFFLFATLVLFHPGSINKYLNIPDSNRYLVYLIGLGVLGLLFLEQKFRAKRQTA